MMNECYRAEARRLALLPEAEQREVIALYLYLDLARSPFATPACRKQAKAKAAALEKLLFPRNRKPAKPRKRSR